jgi:ferredoxin
MRAKVDKDICSGCEVCVEECPEVFELDDDDQATVKVDPIPPEHEEACRDAADQCPTEAIEIEP